MIASALLLWMEAAGFLLESLGWWFWLELAAWLDLTVLALTEAGACT